MNDHSSDDEDELNQELMLDSDAYQSSSPSIQEDEIDFQYVYALRTFTATEQGQVNAVKGDAMILLNDTNSYWWLVRLVKDSSVGFLPAEHIETPSERLARLNKHRNSEFCSPASFSHGFKRLVKKAGSKSVTFTPTLTYVSASEYEYSDGDEADVEDIGDYDSDDEYEDHLESDNNHSSTQETNDFDDNKNINGNAQNTNSNNPETATSNFNPLVIRKPRSDQSLLSDQPSFSTNSDDDSLNSDGPDNHGLQVFKRSVSDGTNNRNSNGTNSIRQRSSSTNAVLNASSSLFSRLSKGVNRRHSAMTTAPANSNNQQNNNDTDVNEANTNNANKSNDSNNSSLSSITHEDDNQSRRRSLINAKSSTEHLKHNSSSSMESIVYTPKNASNKHIAPDPNSNNNTITGRSNRSPKGSINAQNLQSGYGENQPSSSPTSSTSSMSEASSSITSPETYENGINQSYSEYSATAPLNVQTAVSPPQSGFDRNVKSPNSNKALSLTPSSKNQLSTSSINSSSSLISDTSDKEIRSESVATISTVSSSPSFDDINTKSNNTPKDNNNTSNNTSEDDPKINDTRSTLVPIQSLNFKSSNTTLDSSAESFKTIDGDVFNNSHLDSSAGPTDNTYEGNQNTNATDDGLLTLDKNQPVTNISRSSSAATVSALMPPAKNAAIPNSSLSSTSWPKLHPEILPIYQDTVLKLDHISSRIDAILQKYKPVVPVVPTC